MGTKNNPGSVNYYAAAAPDEPIFILRANDPLAPLVVEYWASQYTHFKSMYEIFGEKQEAKVTEARMLADEMRKWKMEHPDKK